jgi:outer membrane lipoprotein-sorting protein
MKNFTTQNNSLRKKLTSYQNFIVLVAVCFAFFASQKSLATDKNFLQEYKPELAQIELYLNNIKNLSAKFIQETSDGTLVEGKFFLSRPGKMRIEYSSKPQIIIAVNGSVLSYLDVELDEISHLGTNTTPASFLTRPNISFAAKDVEITNVKKSDGQIKVSVMKKNRKEAGEFSLVFSTNPLTFRKMEVKNDLDQIISVSLTKIDFASPIPDKIFILKKSSN